MNPSLQCWDGNGSERVIQTVVGLERKTNVTRQQNRVLRILKNGHSNALLIMKLERWVWCVLERRSAVVLLSVLAFEHHVHAHAV